MPSRKPIHIPLEIWLKICGYLPTISPRKLAVNLRARLPIYTKDIKHAKVWDILFDDYEFLDNYTNYGYAFILLGSDLEFLYNFNAHTAFFKRGQVRDLHLVLLCRSYEGYDHPTQRLLSDFAKSAKKEARIWSTAKELKFDYIFPHDPERRLISIHIDIQHLGIPLSNTITVNSPELLVARKGNYLNSAYLYWKYDNKFLRIIEPSDIVGRGRYASVRGTKDVVKEACGLTIRQPEGKPEYNKFFSAQHIYPWQVKFKKYDFPTRGLREKFQVGEPNSCLGWEHIFECIRKEEWAHNPVLESRVGASEEL